MPIFDHFDFLAPYYDRLIKLNHPERLAELANLPTSGSLLDAGGGTGRVASALRAYASQVMVVDLSMGMLRKASTKNGHQLVCSIIESLPFSDSTFDRIIMVDALHHVYNARQTIQELWRVLKPGGRILIEEPDIRTLPVKLAALIEKAALMRSRFLAPSEIARYLSYPGTVPSIQRDGYTSWIVTDKPQ